MKSSRSRVATVAAGCLCALALISCGDSATAPVASTLRITPAPLSLAAGDTTALSATVLDASGASIPGASVMWSSRTPGVAQVLDDGRAIGVTPGSAWVIATSGTAADSVDATVTVGAAANVQMSTVPDSLTPGDTSTLSASATDKLGNAITDPAITWSTSDAAVVTVGASGLVTATGPGTATITATIGQATASTSALIILRFTQVSVGGSNCALTRGGFAYCWKGGQQPARIGLSDRFSEVVAAGLSACGLTPAGAARCWGSNVDGAIGDNTTTDRPDPTAVAGGHVFTNISAGQSHICAVDGGNAGYCWGDNVWGQTGPGWSSPNKTLAPIAVIGGHTFAHVAAGYYYSCGLTPGGALWCWGDNQYGEFGDGNVSFSPQLTPDSTKTAVQFRSVAAGLAIVCGLDDGGTAYCWGGTGNALGRPADSLAHTPEPIEGSFTFTELAAGDAHECGLAPNGTVLCWGDNGAGQLGDNTMSGRTNPSPVSGGLTFIDVSARWNRTCAVTDGGIVYCWGFAVNTDSDFQLTPSKVPGQD